MRELNSPWRSHTYRTSEICVITCWLYWSLVNRMVGYCRDFDFVVVINITDDDDWMGP